jgi:endonuclease/exonuclease/phosphatase family metal-dependent hydrolase
MPSMTFWNIQRMGTSSTRSIEDMAKMLTTSFKADLYGFVELTSNADQVLCDLVAEMQEQLGQPLTYSFCDAGDGWDVYGLIGTAAVNAPALSFYDLEVPRLYGKRRLGMTVDRTTNTTIFIYHAPPTERLARKNLQYILQALTESEMWIGKRTVVAGDFNAQIPPKHLFGFAQITAGHYVTTQFRAARPLDYFVCTPLVRIVGSRSSRMTRGYSAMSDHLPIRVKYQ